MGKERKRIVIVGASSGFGLALAKLYMESGWIVGLAARRTEPLERLKSQLPSRVSYARLDVMEPEAPEVLRGLIEHIGGMDVYLHVAGILLDEGNGDTSSGCRIAETNATGFARMILTAFEYFRKSGRRGQIAAITSIAGIRGLGDLPVYSASKAFDSTLLEGLRQKADRLRLPLKITDIKPGWTRTPLLDSGRTYFWEMDSEKVTLRIFEAILKEKRSVVIGKRWKVATFIERIIPGRIWSKLHIPLWRDKQINRQ